jgi:Flp pilus assembly protein TadD
MNVGMPGTGIGGMFYVVSALAMPLWEAYRRSRSRTPATCNVQRATGGGGWGMVAGQLAITGGIIAGIWATGWLLGLALRTAQPILPAGAGTPAANVVRTVALAVSLGTLVAVLLAVEVLRLVMRRRAATELATRPQPVNGHSSSASADAAEPRRLSRAPARDQPRITERILPVLLAAAVAAHTQLLAAQNASPVGARLARADSASEAGDTRTAEREYAAALLADPENSRATFRLAQLRRRDAAEALRLFRRYVELEPSDPWGYMAVADLLSRAARHDAALEWCNAALRLAPGERDAIVGRARVLARARRTDAAIAAYAQWLAGHPTDAEGWRELAREQQRAGRPQDATRSLERAQALAPDPSTVERLAVARGAAAPAITPLVSGTRDSDGNTTFRIGAMAELPTRGPARLGVVASREQVRDAFATADLDHLALRAAWQPRAVLKVDAAAGATWVDAIGGLSATVIPTGQVRARWRAPAAGPTIDLRVQRSVLAASPVLVANQVVRTEVRTMVELPVVRSLRLRGIGRTAALSDSADVNRRTTVSGVVALAAMPAVEVSGQFHETRYARPSAAGYFAPRLAQVLEAGTYMEFETSASVLFALDIGAGVNRVAAHGLAAGPWRRALRLYALIVVPLAPGREVRFELEGEDSALASEAATAAEWRYGSASLALRWALP